ncbi:MAG: sugar phosphate isomerase/epimerase [Pirellulales bacterium]|nr:sugar phosphate isomerase/epimerase [Pirellulales bacterium]
MPGMLRREFVKRTMLAGTALAANPFSAARAMADAAAPGSAMRLGLVTYLWGAKWNLTTLLEYLESSGVLGVELRTTHAHGVEPSLGGRARKEVKKRFADSPAVLVGLGSAECFDSPDPAVLQKAIAATKRFVTLSHDVGSSGVKVRPNNFHKGVDHEKTIEQIGKSLNEVGRFAGNLGQQIRLEVHGQCCAPTTIKAIMDAADNPNVFVCWNSNRADLQGKGLKYNFDLLKDRFGATCHIRTLDDKDYPFQELLDLLVAMDYNGWLLMECSTRPPKRPVAELRRQRALFAEMIRASQKA